MQWVPVPAIKLFHLTANFADLLAEIRFYPPKPDTLLVAK